MNIKDMTVTEIQKYLRERNFVLTDEETAAFREDVRAGVRRIYQQLCRQQVLLARELIRLEVMQLYEKDARGKGMTVIAGVDEAGRGPLAGPVVAAAVILPPDAVIYGVDDSKKLTPAKRDNLFQEIKEHAVSWAVGISTVEEIDTLNILRASLLAMQKALQQLKQRPDYVLVDAVRIPGITMPQLPIIKGDGKSISIAAASIMAKVTRDRMMNRFDEQYPGYGFISNKGYGTPDHLEAIRKLGQCPLHRKTFTRNIQPQEICGTLW